MSPMRLEVAGILALGAVFVGAVMMTPPPAPCEPVETIRYVRLPPEIQVKEVEKIVEKAAVCPKVDAEEPVAEDPPQRRRRRHWRRRR